MISASLTPETGVYLILAVGLRLGVLPLHLAYSPESAVRRGFGTALRLVVCNLQPRDFGAHPRTRHLIAAGAFPAHPGRGRGFIRRLDVDAFTR